MYKKKPNKLVNVQEFNYIEVDVLIQHTRMQMYIDYDIVMKLRNACNLEL